MFSALFKTRRLSARTAQHPSHHVQPFLVTEASKKETPNRLAGYDGRHDHALVVEGADKLPCLPTEIWEQIIDILATGEDHDEQRANLLSCCLTCQAWLPRSRYRLQLSIGSHAIVRGQTDVARLAHTLETHPSFASIVTHLHLVSQSEEQAWIFGALTVLAPKLKHLTYLELRNVDLSMKNKDFFKVFSLLSPIQHMVLRHVRYTKGSQISLLQRYCRPSHLYTECLIPARYASSVLLYRAHLSALTVRIVSTHGFEHFLNSLFKPSPLQEINIFIECFDYGDADIGTALRSIRSLCYAVSGVHCPQRSCTIKVMLRPICDVAFCASFSPMTIIRLELTAYVSSLEDGNLTRLSEFMTCLSTRNFHVVQITLVPQLGPNLLGHISYGRLNSVWRTIDKALARKRFATVDHLKLEMGEWRAPDLPKPERYGCMNYLVRNLLPKWVSSKRGITACDTGNCAYHKHCAVVAS